MNDVVVSEKPQTYLEKIAPTNLVGAFTQKGGIEAIIVAVEVEARAQAATLDVTKPGDRKAITSLAYKVSKSKVMLDDTGKDLGADAKKVIDAINVDRKLGRDRLDALRDELLAPVEKFEQIEKDRVAGHEAALVEIEILIVTDGLTAEQIGARLWSVPALEDRAWQEFSERATRAIVTTTEKLKAAHTAALIREEESAELDRLRQAEAERIAAENERKRIEREAQIAADAKALAEMEAEAKIERERKAAALALAEAQLTAKRLADEAEANRIKGHKDALAYLDAATFVAAGASSATIRATLAAFERRPARDWEEFAKEAAVDASAGLIHLKCCISHALSQEATAADMKRQADEAKAREDAAAAVQAEQARVAKIAAEQHAEDEARARNAEHRRAVNVEVLGDLMRLGVNLTEDQCRLIITWIVKGGIRHLSIAY